MYSLVETQKGSTAIYFQGNFYRLQKKNKNCTTRWICTNRKCSSSLTMKNEIIEVIRGKHNHSNVKRSIAIIETVKQIRHGVCDNLSKPVTQIYNEFVSDYVDIFFYRIDSFIIYLETSKWYC